MRCTGNSIASDKWQRSAFEMPMEHAKSEAAMIRQEMESAMKLSVPLKVEVGWGKNWYEAK